MSPLRTLIPWVMAITLTGAGELHASPTTVMGELGESMAREALASPQRTVVDVQHGRHGMDFLYYETVDDQERLHVSEVKAGGSQQSQQLQLSPEEQALLQKHGIKPEPLAGNRYILTQGSHGYNLVQADRALKQLAKMNQLVATLQAGGILGKGDAAALARHLKSLNLSLSPVEEHLLASAARGNADALRQLYPRHQARIAAAQQHATEQLTRIAGDIADRRYTNQLIRIDAQGGRFAILATALDEAGQPRLDAAGKPLTREISNVHWQYYRDSAPFRRLVKDYANQVCAQQRPCLERAYPAAMRSLEAGSNLHQAMQQLTQAAQSPPARPPVTGTPTPVTAHALAGRQPPPTPASPNPPPVSRPVAAELRQKPLLGQIHRLVEAKAGAGAGRVMTHAAGTLALLSGTALASAAVASAPVILPLAAAVVSGLLFDSYLDDKIDTHLEGLQTRLGQEFAAVHQNLAQQTQTLTAIQQDLTILGQQVNYGLALTLEALDRHSQHLTTRIDDLGAQMDHGFASLAQTLLVVDLKLDYGLALQEAQFEAALQAGIKHYDVYLGTGERSSLEAAERQFTEAQARYETLLAKLGAEPERLHAYRLQHALSSYYRTVVYAERAADQPKFAEQAVQTFIAFTEQVREPAHLEAVLPILNYAYISIADVDAAGRAGDQLTQAYATLIQHHLAHNRHNTARAAAAMLTMVRNDDQSRRLESVVRYISGQDADPAQEMWTLEGDWLIYLEQRERPRPDTVFALLACAESLEQGRVAPGYCNLSTDALVAAAKAYENETIHRYVAATLLRNNRIAEAKQILDAYYIADPDFRIKSQIAIAYFLKHEPGQQDRYCRMTRYVMDDTAFPDGLRRDVRQHREKWGIFCPKSL